MLIQMLIQILAWHGQEKASLANGIPIFFKRGMFVSSKGHREKYYRLLQTCRQASELAMMGRKSGT